MRSESRVSSKTRSNLATASVFGVDEEPAGLLHFNDLIALAAALVTLGTLMFGIIWSFQVHGPQARLARAEAAYQQCLRKLAKIRAWLAKQKRQNVVSIILSVMMLGGTSDRLHAATCPGGTVVALIDATTAYDDIDRAAIMSAIESMASSLEVGQRLAVRTISTSADSSRLLFDACVPGEASIERSATGIWNWLTSRPTAAVDRHMFFADLRDAMLPMLHAQEDKGQTALVETIQEIIDKSQRIESLWLFSDLLESAAIAATASIGCCEAWAMRGFG